MSQQKINTRNIVLVLMILAAIAFRFLSFEYKALSNFSPVGAIAIFGGAYFADKWKAYAVVLLSLFLSDVVINHLYTSQWTFFNSDTFWNCVCFALIVLVGSLLKKVNFVNVILIIFAPVLIHWLIMDMPWINSAGGLYPKTIAGYIASLTAALPFEKNMLFGDVVFGAILLGGFEIIQSRYTILRSKKQLAV
jgi:hypothetical protein